MSPSAVGLDVGGTSARAGLAGEDGKVLFKISARTGINTTRQTLLERLLGGIRASVDFAARQGITPAGIGVAMPAFVDATGCIAGSCNLPSLNGVPFPRLLEDEFHLPVHMENDVSAAAYGEYCFGGHRGASRRLLFLAIGTGIGGGMVIEGKLLRLSQGCLGDPGHVIVDPSGRRPCRCGGNGCLEAVASGWALVERARALGVAATPKQVFEAARAGDERFAPLAEEAAAAVGVGLATLCVILNPDTIVLGGGVTTDAGEPFRERAERTMRCHAVPFFSKQARVVTSKIGPVAGLLGAAAVALFPDSA